MALFLGKGKKPSHLSRSSSGFESSHFPSPEYPTPPLSQSSGSTNCHSHALLLPFQMTAVKDLCFGMSNCLLRAKHLSQSYDALFVHPAPQRLWKRCLSLDDLLHDRILHTKDPEDLRSTLSEASEGAVQRQHSAEIHVPAQTESSLPEETPTCDNPEDASTELDTGDELSATFLSVDSISAEVEEEEVPVDTPKAAPVSAALCTHHTKPPVPPKPLQHPFARSKETSPDGALWSSKPFIHRLGKKVQHGRTANLESLVEEKLSLDGIDLTEEPYSDKVSHLILVHNLKLFMKV